MGGWDTTECNVRKQTKRSRLCLLIVTDHFCAAGFGVKASPTATMAVTRTVWSFGTDPQEMESGMMKTVRLSSTGYVRCRIEVMEMKLALSCMKSIHIYQFIFV